MTSFVVVDFETTGRVKGLPELPWQVAFVSLQDGAIAAHREDYLHVPLDRPFNRYAPGRHASIRPQLDAAPEPAVLWPQWRPWLFDAPLAAHNASTERTLFKRIAPLHALGPWIDTLRIARRCLPGLPDYSLSALCAHLSIDPAAALPLLAGRTWHDALYDAAATALLLARFLASPSLATLPLPALAAL